MGARSAWPRQIGAIAGQVRAASSRRGDGVDVAPIGRRDVAPHPLGQPPRDGPEGCQHEDGQGRGEVSLGSHGRQQRLQRVVRLLRDAREHPADRGPTPLGLRRLSVWGPQTETERVAISPTDSRTHASRNSHACSRMGSSGLSSSYARRSRTTSRRSPPSPLRLLALRRPLTVLTRVRSRRAALSSSDAVSAHLEPASQSRFWYSSPRPPATSTKWPSVSWECSVQVRARSSACTATRWISAPSEIRSPSPKPSGRQLGSWLWWPTCDRQSICATHTGQAIFA